jgi:hypothetical protein
MTVPVLLLSAAAAFAADAQAVQVRLEQARSAAPRLAQTAPAIPDSAWREAAAGRTVTGLASVPGEKARIGWGVAVLDVPIGRMWGALNEELHHQELLGLGHVEIVRGAPCADRRHVMMVLPLPIVNDRWWVVENRENAGLETATSGRARELTWDSVADPAAEPLSPAARAAIEGAVPVRISRGAWWLVDLDGTHTLAEYHAWTDPGGDLPAGVASRFAHGAIADTIDKLEAYATTAAVRCPG